MADRSLKGSGLGAKSFEDEAGIDFEPRCKVGFVCSRQHQFSVVFAQDAEMPTEWTCPRCGTDASRTDGQRSPQPEQKPARTHWDMLRERRSVSDLERLLAERLTLLRTGQIGPHAASDDSLATVRSQRRAPARTGNRSTKLQSEARSSS